MKPAILVLLLALTACSDPEGSYAGECLDNIDNDKDGLVDCEDDDCSGSSDCQGGGDGTTFPWDTNPGPSDTDPARLDTGFDDSGPGPGLDDMAIDEISYSYTSSEWDYYVLLAGWGSDVLLDWYWYEGGYTWEEWHYFDNTDCASDGSWDEWQRTIPIVTDYTDQQNDVNTLFQGDADWEAELTWMITAFTMSGSSGDCVVWGKHAEYYGPYGCLVISF